MGFVFANMAFTYTFLYGIDFPRKWEISLVVLAVYVLHLALSGGVVYGSLRICGVSPDPITGFSKAVFTVFIRDLIALPLIGLIAVWPLFGIIVSFMAWFGLLKYLFGISWMRTIIVFLVSLILPFVILLLVLIPAAVFLMG